MLIHPVALHAALVFSENFDNVTALTGNGWVITNNSTSGGSTSWFQGNPGVFSAQAGATPDSYIAANYNNAPFGGDISNWLISPQLVLNEGEVFSFFTRTEVNSAFPDALEVRLSTSGSSTNVGTTTTSTGVFTNLLLSINPTLAVGGYPSAWTLETITLSGLGGPVTGRIAFRYALTDTSVNGDYIGIDTFSVTSPVPEPSTAMLLLGGGIILAYVSRKRSFLSARQ